MWRVGRWASRSGLLGDPGFLILLPLLTWRISLFRDTRMAITPPGMPWKTEKPMAMARSSSSLRECAVYYSAPLSFSLHIGPSVASDRSYVIYSPPHFLKCCLLVWAPLNRLFFEIKKTFFKHDVHLSFFYWRRRSRNSVKIMQSLCFTMFPSIAA